MFRSWFVYLARCLPLYTSWLSPDSPALGLVVLVQHFVYIKACQVDLNRSRSEDGSAVIRFGYPSHKIQGAVENSSCINSLLSTCGPVAEKQVRLSDMNRTVTQPPNPASMNLKILHSCAQGELTPETLVKEYFRGISHVGHQNFRTYGRLK